MAEKVTDKGENFSKKKISPSAVLSPVPVVMVTSGTKKKSNIITVAWTGTVNSDPPCIFISVRKERYSYGMMKESGVFAVNAVSEDIVKAADFCGVKSGRDLDKFSETGLTKFYGESGVPMIAESPLSLECRVKEVIELGSHDMFIAEITGVYVSGKLMNDKGSIDFGKAGLAAYCHGEYFALGKKLGFFGFSVASEDVLKRRMKKK